MDMNSITLTGNAVSSPDYSSITTKDGKEVPKATFRIGHNPRRDFSMFLQITCFGQLAVNSATFVTKGKKIGIEGRLEISGYTDKEGKNRYYTEIIANKLVFLDKIERS